ncbi:kelch-like protein 34 [Rhinatrema bivittatum]|uniref:kelch-like protein 34 n=1 Tax=Rhinatrema bivittatum TaxID=194408 RepID=UPI00112D9ADB|nr:kelch-like protein 34 [Rhinatrema bivittatum]
MSYFLAFCKSHPGTVLTRYRSLRSEGLLCDVLLEVNGREFPAHKSLLACSSDYFRAMFKDYTKESKAAVIHLKAISAPGLQHILDFIYTSWLSLSLDTLEDTLEAASYLQVTEAITLCSQYIVSNLGLENCCFFANIASKFCLPDAISAADKYIINNIWKLLEQELGRVELLELNFKSLLTVVQSADVCKVKEHSLLKLVERWVKHDRSRLVNTNHLLENIRFGLIPLEELRKFYSQQEVPLTGTIKNLIIRSINYHTFAFKQPILQDKYSTLRNQKPWIMLVGGGTASEGLVNNVLAFDVYNHRWRTTAQLPVKVQNHCICVAGNFLYLLGGEISSSATDGTKNMVMPVTNRVLRYDPRCDRWLEVTSMLESRAQFSCCMVENNIFAIGGRNDARCLSASVEVYDISRDRWTKMRDLPCKMHGHASTVHNNIIYISGGKYTDQVNTSKDVYSFNMLKGQWKIQAPMSIARFGHQMATVKEAIFTFLGMYEPFCDIEKFDPIRNQWTRLRPLIFDRFCYGLVVVEETVLLLGGKKWQDAQEVATPNVVGYDTENDCWEDICKLPCPLYGLKCEVLQLTDLANGDEKSRRRV